MFGRRNRVVVVYDANAGNPGGIPADKPEVTPIHYPDFFDSLWYLRRLAEYSNGERADAPTLLWLSSPMQEFCQTPKGKRNITYFLQLFARTIRELQLLENDLQNGTMLDAHDLVALKETLVRVWENLELWLQTADAVDD